jgi:3-oxoacyl-[acyl-carrier protein] reductase
MTRFNDRVAVITGGASGIGLAAAQRLASEGAQIILWDRDAATLETAAQAIGATTRTTVLDVTDAEAVERAAKAAGRIDILVTSAGITGPNAPVKDYPLAAWRQVFDVNVHGLFYCNRAVVPIMLEAGYGRIVNIASVAGKEGNPNASAYSASKAAVIGLTKSLGKELANTAIRVNCITPAAVRTALFDQMSEEFIGYMLSKIPVGRFGTVDEIASMIAFLASEECSFSTSGVFDASGGRATY